MAQASWHAAFGGMGAALLHASSGSTRTVSTWAFVVLSAPGGATRLVVRERYTYLRPWAALLVEPVEMVSFVMSRRMLRGIADRAEHVAAARS